MLYTCSHRSLAMLEILVHWQRPTPPPDFVVVVIFVPDSLARANNLYLIKDWQQDQHWSQETGDLWLKEKKTLLMKVPSVLVPNEPNYLINPLHPDAEAIKVINIEPFEFDNRLFGTR